MHICGQTLVLIDSDASVSEVNQKLTDATLKYIIYHRPEDRMFALSDYGHDIPATEVYQTDTDELLYTLDSIEFTAKDSNLSDTLSEVIGRWKESDFACRDILVFTDGLESDAFYHEKEELYYLLENTEYPVYVVMLDQDNNAFAKKGLSAIAVTSGGKLFETDFPGSEAGVDRQLCEQIFAAMDEYKAAHWAVYEEAEEDASEEYAAEEDAAEDEASEEYAETETAAEEGLPAGYEENAENMAVDEITFARNDSVGFFDGSGALILSAALLASGLIAAIIVSFVIMKHRRVANRQIKAAPVDDEDYFEDYELGGMNTVMLTEQDTDDSATRILSGGRIVTLTEKGGAGRTFRIVVASPMSIGRGSCDVIVPGDDAISKRHCELYVHDDSVYVRDLSSANGTRVNNVRIKELKLSDGDELTIGTGTYTVRYA